MATILDTHDFPVGPQWLRANLGRAVMGVALTMGWFYCLNQLLVAAVLFFGESRDAMERDLYLIVLQQILQLIAGVIGAVVVGAGNQTALLYGAGVGAANGLIFMVTQSANPAMQTTVINYYSQPLLHTAIGAFGSLLGAWLWPPLPTLTPLLQETPSGESPLELHRRKKLVFGSRFSELSWRVHWFRVVIGTAVAVAGVMSANYLLHMVMIQIPKIRENLTLVSQQRLFTTEIAGLAIFVGAALAGANTFNGAIQGLCVGFLSASMIVGYQLAGTDDFFAKDMNPIVQVAGILGLSIAAGWIAGVILPPLRVDRSPKFRGLHLS
jgi:hypothetical protein